jgi:uncharacterized protein YybS (DUF2232 family)
MERIQTKALVEGAIFAGITVVLGLLYYYTQYLGIIAMVWPVPVIIVGYRNGLKASILSALSAGLIVSLLTHPLVGIGLLVGFGLPGILMGYMINKKINLYVIISICGLVLSLTMVGEFMLSLMATGIDITQFLSSIDASFSSQIEGALNLYRQMGIAEKELQVMESTLNETIKMMKLVFPSGLVVSGLLFSFIDYKLTRLILKRIGHIIPNVEEFSRWRLIEPYSLILVGLAVAAQLIAYFKVLGLDAAALNVSTVLMLVFTIIGISVIVYYSKVYGDRQGIPKGLRTAIVVVLVLTFMQVIAFVGILDILLNFRKLESLDSGGTK